MRVATRQPFFRIYKILDFSLTLRMSHGKANNVNQKKSSDNNTLRSYLKAFKKIETYNVVFSWLLSNKICHFLNMCKSSFFTKYRGYTISNPVHAMHMVCPRIFLYKFRIGRSPIKKIVLLTSCQRWAKL